MGKGDVKSRKGKIWRGSYGKTRKSTSAKRKAARAKIASAGKTKATKTKKGK